MAADARRGAPGKMTRKGTKQDATNSPAANRNPYGLRRASDCPEAQPEPGEEDGCPYEAGAANQFPCWARNGELQLSLFDDQSLAEITSADFPSERLVVCRNPHVAQERRQRREELLQATESPAREGECLGRLTARALARQARAADRRTVSRDVNRALELLDVNPSRVYPGNNRQWRASIPLSERDQAGSAAKASV